MADDEPTKHMSGCAACGWADGGCSLCSGLSVLELMRSHDDAEAVLDAAGAAKVAAAAMATEPPPPPERLATFPTPAPSAPVELALIGKRVTVKHGWVHITIPLAEHGHVGDGPATYAEVAPEHVAALVQSLCQVTGIYPTPPGAGR